MQIKWFYLNATAYEDNLGNGTFHYGHVESAKIN